MKVSILEKEFLCDNCHRNNARIAVVEIGIFRRDIYLCQKCLTELYDLLSDFIS